MRLAYPFYNQHVVTVAQRLLGTKLVWNGLAGIITETEAYRGLDDAASHAARGITPRSEIMFGPPGKVYVYFIYGMYHCLNIVTEGPGEPSAVLIRGIKLPTIYLDGPGKICRHLGINSTHNGIDLTQHSSIYLLPGLIPSEIIASARIGIKKATDKLWRFTLPEKEIADL